MCKVGYDRNKSIKFCPQGKRDAKVSTADKLQTETCAFFFVKTVLKLTAGNFKI